MFFLQSTCGGTGKTIHETISSNLYKLFYTNLYFKSWGEDTMDIDTEISMEGKLHEFQFEHLSEKKNRTSILSSVNSQSESRRKKLRGDRISDLRKKLEQIQNSIKLLKMKLQYAVNNMEGILRDSSEDVAKIDKQVTQLTAELKEGMKDRADIQFILSRQKLLRADSRSYGSVYSEKNKSMNKKAPSPAIKTATRLKNSEPISPRSKQKVKREKHISPSDRNKSPGSSIKPKSTDKLQSTSKGKQKKKLRNFVF